jgi:hypothetical protein
LGDVRLESAKWVKADLKNLLPPIFRRLGILRTPGDVLNPDKTIFSAMTQPHRSQTHETSAGAVIAVDAHDTDTLAGVTVAQLQAAQNAHVDRLHFF